MNLHSFLHPALVLPLAFPLVLCLLLISLVMHGAAPVAAQVPDTFAVKGKVSNGTIGGQVPSNLPVTLHAIAQDAGRVATYNTATDEEGEFTFEAITPLGSDGSYVLVMDYADMRYSELLDSYALAEPAELTVYETTGDIGVIRVDRQAMIIADINETDREVRALEVLGVSNTSDRTLLPELTNITNPADINFLRFSLPVDAIELSVQSTLPGGDIIPMGTGFAVTSPVLPGEHEITYTYKFPYAGDSVTFNQRLIQGAEQYQVLAPASLSQIQVLPLEPKPRIDVSGTAYLVWEATEVPPGRGVSLQITQLPQPGIWSRFLNQVKDGDIWLGAIPVMLGVALAAVLFWAWFRAPRTAGAAAEFTADGLQQSRRQSAVQAIAVLDERYERGQVENEEYRPRREELMTQLRQASPDINGGQTGP